MKNIFILVLCVSSSVFAQEGCFQEKIAKKLCLQKISSLDVDTAIDWSESRVSIVPLIGGNRSGQWTLKMNCLYFIKYYGNNESLIGNIALKDDCSIIRSDSPSGISSEL